MRDEEIIRLIDSVLEVKKRQRKCNILSFMEMLLILPLFGILYLEHKAWYVQLSAVTLFLACVSYVTSKKNEIRRALTYGESKDIFEVLEKIEKEKKKKHSEERARIAAYKQELKSQPQHIEMLRLKRIKKEKLLVSCLFVGSVLVCLMGIVFPK